jgi:hypothetical protein
MDEAQARRLAVAAAAHRAQLGTEAEGQHAAVLNAAAASLSDAIETLRRIGDGEAALAMAGDLSVFWQDAGLVETGRAVTETALSGATEEGVPRARAALAASELAFRQGDRSATSRWAEEAIALAAVHGAPAVAGRAHINLARGSFRDEDADGITEHVAAAEAVAGDDPSVRRGILHMRAWDAYVRGDVDEARRRFAASKEHAERIGDRFTAASEGANLADLALETGDVDAAIAPLGDALTVATELGSRYLALGLVASIARCALLSGRAEEALTLVTALDAAYRDAGLIGDPTEEGDRHAVGDEARRLLGDERAEASRVRGAVMTYDDMIEVAAAVLRSPP